MKKIAKVTLLFVALLIILAGMKMNEIVIYSNGCQMPVINYSGEKNAREDITGPPMKYINLTEDVNYSYLSDRYNLPVIGAKASLGDSVLTIGLLLFFIGLLVGEDR